MKHSQKKETRDKVDKLLQQYKEYKDASTEDEKNRIGDEMTYADPIVWMMYKHQAYLRTDHKITIMRELRDHCNDHGGICAKRFNFLFVFIKTKYSKNITDPKEFPNDMRIEEFYESELMDLVVSDEDFMNQWRKYEFYKRNERVAKWEIY